MLTAILLMAIRIQADTMAAPSRQPQLAAANGQVAMTFGSGRAIYFTSSNDQGVSFGPPVKVAEVGALALGRHRGPRIAILKDVIVISAVAGEKQDPSPHAHGLPQAGDLAVWRSTDHGKTWTRAGTINDVVGAAREGLHAMAADRSGNLYAAWLDLRDTGTRLYGARSVDHGLTWSKNVLIYASPDGTICQCCDPAIAFDEEGRTFVMWRNAVSGSRDLYVASSGDGRQFGDVRKLGNGTWKINACPMDGGGLAIRGGAVMAAWRREGDVFLVEGNEIERRVGSGKDIAMTVGQRGAYVAWTNGESIELLRPQATTARQLAAEGAFVNLVAVPDGGVVAAWESHGSIETTVVH